MDKLKITKNSIQMSYRREVEYIQCFRLILRLYIDTPNWQTAAFCSILIFQKIWALIAKSIGLVEFYPRINFFDVDLNNSSR